MSSRSENICDRPRTSSLDWEYVWGSFRRRKSRTPNGALRHRDQGRKAEGKPLQIADEKGLFLLVSPSGGKLWRLKDRFGGKERALAAGHYPEVILKEARARRDASRHALGAARVRPSSRTSPSRMERVQ